MPVTAPLARTLGTGSSGLSPMTLDVVVCVYAQVREASIISSLAGLLMPDVMSTCLEFGSDVLRLQRLVSASSFGCLGL